jgi:hypothetical protein
MTSRAIAAEVQARHGLKVSHIILAKAFSREAA